MKSIILLIFIFLNNAFCATLTASMINPTNTVSYLGLLALMVLSLLLGMIAYRKTLNIMGK